MLLSSFPGADAVTIEGSLVPIGPRDSIGPDPTKPHRVSKFNGIFPNRRWTHVVADALCLPRTRESFCFIFLLEPFFQKKEARRARGLPNLSIQRLAARGTNA